jgi:hypothetical protein
MTAAALAMQRIHPRTAILIALLLAAAAVAVVIAATLHGAPVHGTGAMVYDGPKSKMVYD